MWAYVRTSGSGNNNKDAAIWWILDVYRAHFRGHRFQSVVLVVYLALGEILYLV